MTHSQVADLSFEAEGLRVHTRHSKTDQEGRGQEIATSRGTKLRPVNALEEWLQAGRIESGPMFRSIDPHGRMGAALSAQSVAMITKHQAEAVGLDRRTAPVTACGYCTTAAVASPCRSKIMSPPRRVRSAWVANMSSGVASNISRDRIVKSAN